MVGFDGMNAHESSPAPTVFELNNAGGTSEQRIVFSPTHVVARLEPSTSLANDDGSSRNPLPAEGLDAQSL